MNDFIFNFIFENEKDQAWPNSHVFRGHLRKKYGISDTQIGTKLYISINKYQVKKYGRSIQPHNIRYREDYLRRAEIVRQDKYRKLR